MDTTHFVDTERGLLDPRIFEDQEVYDIELAELFARAWLFLAHDSMIPKTGDFLQTYMAEDPVLVVRQRDGSVRAFLNQCRHRGMRICRADQGNIKAFTCTYHGWTYDISGKLINVPHEEDGYHSELDKDAWGPIQVAKIENYKGFWFATWDDRAPSFRDYLGDMAWYFDAYIDRHEGGVEVIGSGHKWIINCNWKFAAEQFASDMYHGDISHASAMTVQWGPEAARAAASRVGRQFSSQNGHGTGFFAAHNVGTTGTWADETRNEVAARLGEARATDYMPVHATIFPNFSLLVNGPMRVWHPRGPREIEVWAWTYVPTAAPDHVKNDYRINTLRTFSPGGLWEQDDGENWNEIQKVLRGYIARAHPLNAQMGISHAALDVEGLPGRTNFVFGEEAARGLYRRWAEFVSGMSWRDLMARRSETRSNEPARH